MARRIGVLGGMGPEATVLLMQKLIAATPAQDDADHIPLIVDQNSQVPSRIRHLIDGDGEDPGPVLAVMARGLQTAGAEALAMACNTAHHYAPQIRAAVTIPLIDMVAVSIEHAVSLVGPNGRLGILASPMVRRIGLFDAVCAKAGLIPLYGEDEPMMLRTIRSIKATGVSVEAKAALRLASEQMLKRGAQVQMIACTEFSLISGATATEATTFDSLDRLVDGILAFALPSDVAQISAGDAL